MKKFLSLLLLATILLGLVACGNSVGNDSTEPTTDEPTTEDNVTTEPVTTEPETTTEPEVTTEPVIEEEKFVYKHVVIVGIDGMGAYHKNADTPNMDRIFADYALTDVAQTYAPVASGPSWLSMMTGVDPYVMRVTKNAEDNVAIKRYSDALAKYDTLFTLVHDTYPDATIASITGYEPMQKYIWNDEDYIYKQYDYREWWSNAENTEKAVDYIENLDLSKPSFTFIYYIEPDSTGHKYEWGSEQFNSVLTECDAGLGAIFDACEARGMLDDTLFIMATDHGGEGTKHGLIMTPAALTITLGFRGKTVNNVKDFNMIFRDIAPMVVEAMGLQPGSKWSTLSAPPVVPEGVFTDLYIRREE